MTTFYVIDLVVLVTNLFYVFVIAQCSHRSSERLHAFHKQTTDSSKKIKNPQAYHKTRRRPQGLRANLSALVIWKITILGRWTRQIFNVLYGRNLVARISTGSKSIFHIAIIPSFDQALDQESNVQIFWPSGQHNDFVHRFAILWQNLACTLSLDSHLPTF